MNAEKAVQKIPGKSIAAILTALIIIAAYFALHSLPTSGSMFVVEVDTEVLDVKVFNPDNNRITLSRALNAETEYCIENIEVTPQEGATISYSRKLGGPLYLFVDKVQSLSSNLSTAKDPLGSVRLVLDEDNKECLPDQAIRLPTNGSIIIGSESHSSPTDETLVASAMDVKIYGRATDRIFGLIPLTWEPFRPGVLYLSEELTVPAGSRLSGARSDSGSVARWWGYVDVIFDGSIEKTMFASVATNAVTVDIFAAAPSGSHSVSASISEKSRNEVVNSDLLSVSLGTRLLKDPNMIWLYTLIALIGTVLGVYATIVGFFDQNNGEQ